MKAPKKERADALLVSRGLADSRSKAQALIMAGQVMSGERRIDKAGDRVAVDAELSVKERPRFVSRGGDKLEHAMVSFVDAGLSARGKICVDVGASTGGFTDCLLQHGAKRVHAVDVGWGQLHPKLRNDVRVDVRERTNARHLTAADFPDAIDLVVVDASFIGIGKLLDAIVAMRPREMVALIKPQFEVGKQVAAKARGVIKDPMVRRQAIDDASQAIEEAGFRIVAATDCSVRGPKGNVEHLLYVELPDRSAE